MNAPLILRPASRPLSLPVPGDTGAKHPVKRRLGDILIRDGLLLPDQLRDALNRQARLDAPLGEIIASEGFASQTDVTEALAQSCGTTRVDLDADPPDPRLASALKAEDCLRHKVVAWRRSGAITVLACADPGQASVLFRRLPNALRPARFTLAEAASLDQRLAKLYGPDLARLAEERAPEAHSCRKWQPIPFLICLALLALGVMAFAPHLIGSALFWIAATVLLSNTALKLACLLAALRRPERTRAALPASQTGPPLPKISILVPLFRESNIAETLIKRLGAIDYPAPLLEICLVTEADDHLTRDTLRRTDLPGGMRAVTVPVGTLKTKPRAMNYALEFTSGAIIGVYDAEDAPETNQLYKVAARFAASDEKLACLQGILSFYNPRAGWLARCFSFEYAAWFGIMLPGLQRMGFAIPLGGTTLFFRRGVLLQLGAWDAHNVTEDAELGMRLAREGYRAEMIDTVTQEEANNRLWPWVRQRSRWLKGYAMTWCVHMRQPWRLLRDLGPWKFAGFQLLFLGTILAFCLAPLLWWGFAHFVSGGAIPAPAGLAPDALQRLGVLFVTCEGVSIATFLTARRLLSVRPGALWVFTLPAYFMFATLAAYKGVMEMLWKPFFWDKTEHGISPADRASHLSGGVDLQTGLKRD